MSASVKCDGCGCDFTPQRIGEPLTGPGHGHCLSCRSRANAGDIDGATAAVAILRGAVEAALNGHVSPQDALATVGEAVMAMATRPQHTMAELTHEEQTLRAEREAARV